MLMLKLLSILLVLYIGLNILMYIFQDNYIFYPPANSQHLATIPEENHLRLNVDGLQLTGIKSLNISNTNKLSIIYFGGNAEDVSYNFRDFSRYLNTNFFALNYPGYAGNPGKLSLNSLLSNTEKMYSAIIKQFGLDPQKTILMGRSLGSACAIHLSVSHPVAGLIAISPFESMAAVAKRYYAYLPVSSLLKEKLDNERIGKSSKVPIVIIAGGDDNIIPAVHAKKLYESWKSSDKTYVEIPNRGHNDIHLSAEYYRAIIQFIDKIAKTTTVN